MKILFNIVFIIFFFSITAYSSESNKSIKIIKLDDFLNLSIDELNQKKISDDQTENSSSLDVITEDVENNLEKQDDINELVETDLIENTNLDSNNIIDNETNVSSSDTLESDYLANTVLWDQIKFNDLVFLMKNIKVIKSKTLKNELLLVLNINTGKPENFDEEDFNKYIIDSLLYLGDRKKAYELIQSFQPVSNLDYEYFYKKNQLDYLLSTFKLKEACKLRSDIKNQNTLIDINNYFLKIDIFCFALEESYDQANILNLLLEDTTDKKDEYFDIVLSKLQNKDIIISDNISFNEENIFLYSAMHKIGEIPLSERFLLIDPINIILSSTTNIQLRLKAAHLAYFSKLWKADSVAALYQIDDFTYEQLNNLSSNLKILENDIERSMAYLYQFINVQIFPKTRLEAIITFWEFAKKNNLEFLAYELSLKSLNTIEPSNELYIYSPLVSKAYIYSNDMDKAKEWIEFSSGKNEDKKFNFDLNSSILLYNLHNIKENQNLVDVLFENLNIISKDLNNLNTTENNSNNEILNIVFSILNSEIPSPFIIENKINESRNIPSLFILDKIRKSAYEKNNLELLLSVLASLEGKDWNQLHPEHLRIILNSLKHYKGGIMLNNILLEILQNSRII